MSKFFRKNPDSDSSSSASDSEEIEEDDDYFGQQDDNLLARSQELEVATPPVQGPPNAVAVAGPNKDLLLHALLEEKCLNDVRTLLPDASEAVNRRKAQERYRALSARLGHVGLAAPGLDDDAHMDIRMQYRRGLGLLADNVAVQSMSNGLRPSAQRLLTGNDTQYDMQQLQLPQHVPTIPPALGHLVPQRLFFGPSRYREEFEEVGILGRGGYGIVYQCKHRLDSTMYAVKKVPVRPTISPDAVPNHPKLWPNVSSSIRVSLITQSLCGQRLQVD